MIKEAIQKVSQKEDLPYEEAEAVMDEIMSGQATPVQMAAYLTALSMKELEGKLPDVVMACVGGGSNAIGSFYHFIQHPEVRLIGCEAAGRGVDTFETAATIATGKLGIFHGMKSYFCQDESCCEGRK